MRARTEEDCRLQFLTQFAEIVHRMCRQKNFENRSIFSEDMDNDKVESSFWGHSVTRIRHQRRDTLQHWAATSIRHCSQPPSVIQWTSPSRRPLAGSSPSSWGLHYGLSWWLETEGRSPQTILAQNRGGWPAANESRTSDGETTRPGQIGMAATCGNGYVFDKLLKKKFPRSGVTDVPIFSSET